MRFGRRAWALAVAAMFVAVAAGRTEPQVPSQAGTGVLLLAHGGSPQWNDNVRALASRVDKDMPTEVAFGWLRAPISRPRWTRSSPES